MTTDRGSVFLYCPVLKRYPPQPVFACDSYRAPQEGPGTAPSE